jgi:hypothetical protein
MPALNDLAARTELRPFESLTLTDQQFLIGDKNGKAVTLAGGAPNCLQAGHRPTGSLGLKQRPPLARHRGRRPRVLVCSRLVCSGFRSALN